jgi:tetratricopeptide (TPR) repeat protein
MLNLKQSYLLALAAALITFVLSTIAYFSDIGIWGLLTTRAVNQPLFFILIALAIIFLVASSRSRSSDSPGRAESPALLKIGLIAGVVATAVIFLTSNGGYFWRVVLSGPVSIFGSWDKTVAAYSDLPPKSDFTDIWAQTAWMRILSALLGGICTFLFAFTVGQLTDNKSARLPAFLFLATLGSIAVFSRPGDFGVLILLFVLNAYLSLRFINGRSSMVTPAIVLILSSIYHPVFLLFAIALLFIRVAGPMLATGKLLIPAALVVASMILGGCLGLMEPSGFTSVLRPQTSASASLNLSQLSGLLNQLLMISNVLVFLAVITFIYSLLMRQLKDLRGMLVGVWFMASLTFTCFVYPDHGWIMSFSTAAISVVPAAIWLTHFFSTKSNGNRARAFRPLIIANVFTTLLLLLTVSSNSSAHTYNQYLDKSHAFDRSFKRGENTLLMGIMLSEDLEMYEEAVPYLEEYRLSYPADEVATYHLGWALTNIKGRLVDGVDLLTDLEPKLVKQDKLFWEFNYRIGWKRLVGHNATLGSVALERAAAEHNTAQISKWLGTAYEILKVWDSMASKYVQAIDLGDSSRENFFKIADGALKLGDSARALRYFRYGVDNFPSYLANYDVLAEHYYLSGHYDSLEALAEHGLKYLGRSRPLEACMILVYDATGRTEQRDSLYNEFIDYFQTYPNALYEWGQFLIDNGLIYLGRKMQAADQTADQDALRAVLGFYHYYKGHGMPDSAKSLIDRFDALDSTGQFDEMLKKVRQFDTVLWPEPKYRLDSN